VAVKCNSASYFSRGIRPQYSIRYSTDFSSSSRPDSGFMPTLKRFVVTFFHMVSKSYRSTTRKGVFSHTFSECYHFVNGIQIEAYRHTSFDILHLFRDSWLVTDSTQGLYILPALVATYWNVKLLSASYGVHRQGFHLSNSVLCIWLLSFKPLKMEGLKDRQTCK
jgi:hypothetical protein